MKKILLYLCLSLCATTISAQINYQPTDPDNPIAFDGKILTYKGDTIILGPKAFFIDGSLPDSIARTFPYVYTSMNEAASHLTPGNAEEPMTLYFAPWVYWIDNPDDPEIRRPQQGSTPYGLIIRCPGLSLNCLLYTSDAADE